MLTPDLQDRDYDYFILGTDAKGCFPAVSVGASIPTLEDAQANLEKKLAQYAILPSEELHQGDKTGKSVDFFIPMAKDEMLINHWSPAAGADCGCFRFGPQCQSFTLSLPL